MRVYFSYVEGGIEELGETTREQVPLLIDQAEASLSGDKQFGVGFYRTERDFVEVTPVGKTQYMIWSDLISGNRNRGFVARFLRRKTHIDKIVAGRILAIAAACDYFDCQRDEFERKYG
jgi:hypothetical protein